MPHLGRMIDPEVSNGWSKLMVCELKVFAYLVVNELKGCLAKLVKNELMDCLAKLLGKVMLTIMENNW